MKETESEQSSGVTKSGGKELICHQMVMAGYLYCHRIFDNKSTRAQQGQLRQAIPSNAIHQRHAHASNDSRFQQKCDFKMVVGYIFFSPS